MNKPQKNWQSLEELPEETVADYLRRHPEFFIHHENLLATMEIPHASGTATSLIERKLAVLREENQQLQRQLDELVAIAHKNEQLNRRIRHLIADLTDVMGIDEFFHTLYSTLCNEFNTDAVVVRWFESPQVILMKRQEFVEYDAQIFSLFESVLENYTPLCGQLSPEQLEYLFPNSQIASAVLIPLGVSKPQGLLAMGSHDMSRFHAKMGTELLQYLGELVSHLLKMWLRPDSPP